MHICRKGTEKRENKGSTTVPARWEKTNTKERYRETHTHTHTHAQTPQTNPETWEKKNTKERYNTETHKKLSGKSTIRAK